MKPFLAAAAIAALAIASPAGASAARLQVDPVWKCYREGQTVSLPGTGFTPNGLVEISRRDRSLGQLRADGVGAFQGTLRLPGLVKGQRRFRYVATDKSDPQLTAQVTVRVTSTDVFVRPMRGAPDRRLTINGRGFFGGETLWAHIRRARPGARARTVRVGEVKGACRTVRGTKRLFRATTSPGTYRVQFDTFRRYRPRRHIEYDDLLVRIHAPQQPVASVSESQS
jgi:hypothetical protein